MANVIRIKGGHLYVSVPFDLKDRFKMIPGYQWHKDRKQWSCPVESKFRLYQLFPEVKENSERMINNYFTELKEIKKAKEEVFREKVINYVFKREPYEHQRKMMKHGIIESVFAYFTEMGTGKSQVLVNVADYLYQVGLVRKILIICPKTIMINWGEEIEENSNRSWILIDGNRKKREKLLSGDEHFKIINFEAVRTLKNWEGWSDFNCVIVDESSRIKNPDAQITKIIINLFKNTPYKYIASGTPLQKPLDIFTQMKFLSEHILGYTSYYSFRNYYAVMGGYGGYEILTYKHLDELKRRISKYSIQLKKEQCVDLPAKSYTKRILPLTGKLKEQYEQMSSKSILLTEDGALTAPIILTELLRLQEITSGAYLQDPADNHKLRELAQIILDNRSQQQIVVWCRFRKSVDMIEKLCTVNEWKYEVLHGDRTIEERQQSIKNFQSGKSRVFIGQIQTGGMGITLNAGSLVIYYENTFSLSERKQSEDRCHRIGQKNKVTYVDICYDRTIDTKIL